MGYEELKGKEALKKVLDRDDTVTMLVMGMNNGDIAAKAKEVMEGESKTRWWVVWIQDTDIFTDEQIKLYLEKDKKEGVCTLSISNKVVERLDKDLAIYKNELLKAFLKAQKAD